MVGRMFAGPLVWSARAGEVEKQMIAFLRDLHMEAHRLVEIDAVAVDETLAFAYAVRPRSDLGAHLGFRQGEELFEGFEYGLLAVACHHFLEAPFAQARGADLAAQIADDQLRRATVTAEHGFDVLAGLIGVDVFDRRHVQAFLINFTRLTPAASRHRPADVALVR